MNNTIFKMEDINKYYITKTDKLHIIDSLNIEVKKGEFISILGKSGSGKTTLLNLIALLDNPDSGRRFYEDSEADKMSEKEKDILRSEFLGFIFQFHYLLPEFNALENVMIPALAKRWKEKKVIERRAKELLEELELGERMLHRPSELSGGEKQRVAIARSLINNPKMILADEPTGNLDDETSNGIHILLKKINKERGQTILVVTHSSELAAITDKQLILKKGNIKDV